MIDKSEVIIYKMTLGYTIPLTGHVAALLLIVSSLQTLSVCAEKDSNPYVWGENPNKGFKMYWNDAANVIQDLEQFQSLYVKYHGCVWSECSVDSFDDDGEYRDGDEYWYQDRTQPFCANAAYSLYGELKSHWGGLFNSCTRSTYINSFFTYGGADTLLSVLDISTSTIFDDEYVDDDGNSNTNSNAVCYEVEDEYANYNNRRGLGSGDGDDDYQGMSSTMGCSAEGAFSVALFSGDTCDGNHFLKTSDELTKYNRGANRIKCKQIWNLRKDVTNNRRELENEGNDNGSYYTPASSAEALLMNSWACDIQIYPQGCPDPFKLKKKYDAVLAAVSSGQSANKALRIARLKAPLKFLSAIMLLAGLVLLGGAYFIQNKSKGIFTSLYADTTELLCVKAPMTYKYCLSRVRKILGKRQKRKRSKSKKKKYRRRSRREKAAQEIEDEQDFGEELEDHPDPSSYYIEERDGEEHADRGL